MSPRLGATNPVAIYAVTCSGARCRGDSTVNLKTEQACSRDHHWSSRPSMPVPSGITRRYGQALRTKASNSLPPVTVARRHASRRPSFSLPHHRFLLPPLATDDLARPCLTSALTSLTSSPSHGLSKPRLCHGLPRRPLLFSFSSE